MDTKVKNYLGYAGIAIMLVFAYSVLSYVGTYSRSIEPTSFRSFAVTAEGRSVIIPDIAQLTFSVLTEGGDDVVSLQSQNSEKSNKIIEFLTKSGIKTDDIKTINYSIEPRQEYYSCPPVYYIESGSMGAGTAVSGVAMPDAIKSSPSASPRPCPPPKIVGYTIRRTDQVKVRDTKKVGEILSGIVANGGNEVSAPFFTIDDPTKPQNEAREEAIRKAKEKAEAIAGAGGFRLGRLLNISEGGYYPPIPYYAKEMGIGGSADGGVIPPNVQPGSEEVTVNVTMTFEIR